MTRNKSRVKIDYPQGSETHYGEDVTVKTRHEKPEVTSGGGGGGDGCGLGCSEGIFALLIVIALIFYAIRGCIYVVETHIIKGINPNYKTSFEVAEERAKERKTKEEEGAKKRRVEEEQKERVKKSIHNSLGREYHSFILSDYCVIDNCIWVSGSTLGTAPLWDSFGGSLGATGSAYYPLVLFSDDYGENYKVVWENRPIYAYHDSGSNKLKSKIAFSDKNNGRLAIFFWDGTLLFQHKTEDGGKTWKLIPEEK